MPDITMCNNAKCKNRQQCYRFTAQAYMYQTYCTFQPENGECEFFMDNTK